ncbi:OLC1v1003797C1 [Oldenlandia corymbosa var. corymbosa]|uniref:OLC1v1003797C1 n=1 Tax=Oldenlandia corymbosa var. corymbosa TaxID=529605 RepID=A0AAV1DAU8_OLDCO|nr:OLC1v1003797C1 [Oldenlandia corymbosa var. corymbosa]
MENSKPQMNPAKRLQEIYAELFRPKPTITKPKPKPKRKLNKQNVVGPMRAEEQLPPPPPPAHLPVDSDQPAPISVAAPPVVPPVPDQPAGPMFVAAPPVVVNPVYDQPRSIFDVAPPVVLPPHAGQPWGGLDVGPPPVVVQDQLWDVGPPVFQDQQWPVLPVIPPAGDQGCPGGIDDDEEWNSFLNSVSLPEFSFDEKMDPFNEVEMCADDDVVSQYLLDAPWDEKINFKEK